MTQLRYVRACLIGLSVLTAPLAAQAADRPNVVLLHRDPSYMETAGQAAHALTKAALGARKKASRQVV